MTEKDKVGRPLEAGVTHILGVFYMPLNGVKISEGVIAGKVWRLQNFESSVCLPECSSRS